MPARSSGSWRRPLRVGGRRKRQAGSGPSTTNVSDVYVAQVHREAQSPLIAAQRPRAAGKRPQAVAGRRSSAQQSGSRRATGSRDQTARPHRTRSRTRRAAASASGPASPIPGRASLPGDGGQPRESEQRRGELEIESLLAKNFAKERPNRRRLPLFRGPVGHRVAVLLEDAGLHASGIAVATRPANRPPAMTFHRVGSGRRTAHTGKGDPEQVNEVRLDRDQDAARPGQPGPARPARRARTRRSRPG